ncbi:MAG: cell division protein FtsZ, partial [Clostridia bacterium]|nr:cell division protein FtsZ [Clostridia bacterium]
ADDVLLHAIKGIGDLISQPLIINLDFADVCTIMREKGFAHIGIGSAKGPGRAVDAVRQAVNNQLTDTTIYQASGLIISYQAGTDFAVEEIKDATNLVRDVLQEDAEIIFGVNIVPELGDRLDVVVIATGFQALRPAKPAPVAPTASMHVGMEPVAPVAPVEAPKPAADGGIIRGAAAPKFLSKLHGYNPDNK